MCLGEGICLKKVEREREIDACAYNLMFTLSLHVHYLHYFNLLPAQLLLYLKEFSQKMSTKTHEIEKQVDTLVHEAKVSDKDSDNGG